MEDIYGAVEGEGRRGGGITERVKQERRIGRNFNRYDPRKFKHDRLAAQRVTPVAWHVTKDDCMEAEEAGRKLSRIHTVYGIDKSAPEVIEAFNNGLFFAHTINSGSTLQPARSVIKLKRTPEDIVSEFSMMEVIQSLGVDIRRFFRAYADEVRAVNEHVIASYDPADFESVERFNWLIAVAHERGMSRHPELAHDSADKCTGLLPVERAALAVSKVGVFGNIVNTADKIHSNSRVINSAEPGPVGMADRN